MPRVVPGRCPCDPRPCSAPHSQPRVPRAGLPPSHPPRTRILPRPAIAQICRNVSRVLLTFPAPLQARAAVGEGGTHGDITARGAHPEGQARAGPAARWLRGQRPGQRGRVPGPAARGRRAARPLSRGAPERPARGPDQQPQLSRAGPAEGGLSPGHRRLVSPRPQAALPPSYWSLSRQEAWLKATSREILSLIGGGSGGWSRPRGPTRGRARPAGTLCAGPGPRSAAAPQPCSPQPCCPASLHPFIPLSLLPCSPAALHPPALQPRTPDLCIPSTRLTEISARPGGGECFPPRSVFTLPDPLRARGLPGFGAAGAGMCRPPTGGTVSAGPVPARGSLRVWSIVCHGQEAAGKGLGRGSLFNSKKKIKK